MSSINVKGFSVFFSAFEEKINLWGKTKQNKKPN